MALNLIKLPEMKRPEEAEKVNDPNFCRYHRLVSHPTECCFVLKEKIVQLAGQGKILLEENDEIAATHHISASASEKATTSNTFLLQFGSLPPVEVAIEIPEDPVPSLVANQPLPDMEPSCNKGLTIAASEERKITLQRCSVKC